MKQRLARYPVLGTVIAVQDRFGELGGNALANGIALAAFVSIFPLLLVTIAVAGFLSVGDADFATELVDALGLPPDSDAAGLITDALDTAQDSRRAASVVGLVGLLWSGLALVAAIQRAIDQVWQVKGQGVRDKAVALVWLLGAVVIFASSVALTTVLNFLPGIFAAPSVLAGVIVNTCLFLWTFKALGRRLTGWRPLLPGAILGGIGFEILKVVGALVVPRLVGSSSALYGSLGVVFALLTWLAFIGRLVVYGAVLNVVKLEQNRGTVTVEVQVPKVDTRVPLGADRSGSVDDQVRV